MSDLTVYQEIVDIYLRAGLENELWNVYYKMAVILLEQDSHDEAPNPYEEEPCPLP